ncbi:MAG TPA: TauD/TfdA family dioxygenase, partial [Novosphingobium sp.]|nr:TauD/TfdA family dioxygenase [Novosphingobium sp.]
DVRRFDETMPKEFRDEVKRRGVRYSRNFRLPDWESGDAFLDSLHLTWHDVFGTTDKAEAEEACRKMGVEPRWEKNGSLSVLYTTPGFVTHPRTGRDIWFNQIASQSPNPWAGVEGFMERIANFAHLYSEDAPPPYATTFGDGGVIATERLKPIYDLLDSLEIAFPWQRRDVMLLDNFYVFHGRNWFTGPRDVQVALLG